MTQQDRLMKNVLGASTTLDVAFLDGLRAVVDPPADLVALTMCQAGAHKLFAELVKNHQVWEADGQPSRRLPDDVRAYLSLSGALPPWLDRAKVKQSEEFFLLYGISSATLLSCASLPECYIMQYGTDVLTFTKFLQMDPARRIRETAQMIMSVMCPGGLAADGGVGVQATQKVRLMHAIIRYMVEHDPHTPANPADPDLRRKFGRPINQEDLVFTLMTFSYVAVRSFGKLGVRMTDAQKDAYMHCWNVVGFLMGIREDLLPANYQESVTLYDAIRDHQAGASDAGRALTNSLMNLLEQLLPPGSRHVPVLLTRYLIGSDTAAMLGLRQAPLLDRVQLWCILRVWRVSVMVAGWFHGNRPYRFASEWLHRRLLDRMGNLPGYAPFQIPPEFLDQWFPGGVPAESVPNAVK
jgi:hypothetical protein